MGPVSLAVILLVAGAFAFLWWDNRRKQAPAAPATNGNTWRYCPWCKSELAMGEIDGKHRLKCTSCKFVHWDNPRPVAIVLIPTCNGGLVLVKRKLPPRAGMFALPGGFVEPHEMPDAAAKREAKEETGLDIEIERLLWFTMPPNVNEILFFFLARPTKEKPTAGDDAAEAISFARAEIPAEIAFPTHRKVVADWLAATAA